MFFRLSSTTKTLIKTFGFGIPIGITLIDVFGYVAKVEGHSMQPLLNPDNKTSRRESDYVFLHSWPIVTNSFDEIKRGEIIALASPRDPQHRLIKRVIGLGGDVIETIGAGGKTIVEVPKGHCWVEGDNRGHSLDSNVFGPVPLGLIKSKAKFIVWPPKRIQRLDTSVLDDRKPLNIQLNKIQLDTDKYPAQNVIKADSKRKSQ